MIAEIPGGSEVFHPRIVAFVCKWCTYAGADLAGMSRLEYPPEVKTLMLPCSGRIDVTLVLRAFLQGADGVLVSGCHPGDCHYTAGNFRARRRWTLLRDLLDVLGFDLRRLEIAWISAAEGAKWARTVEAFTERVRALGSYEALHRVARDRTPPAVPLQPGGPREKREPAAPAGLGLQAAVREALASRSVEAVLGWRGTRTLGRLAPWLMTDPADVERMAAPGGAANLVRYLVDPRVRGMARVGVVARSTEVAALNVLAQERQVDPARIVVFEVAGDGTFRGTRDLSGATTDLLEELGAGGLVGFSKGTQMLLDDLLARPPEERFRFWVEQSERCVRCYACRGSCPMCRCAQCYADKNQPQWFPTAADGPGNLAWQIVRAFHLAGRCVGCGACQEACPAGIPLNVLGAALARSALRNFGHRAGVDPEAPPLQADYRPGDPQAFIV